MHFTLVQEHTSETCLPKPL